MKRNIFKSLLIAATLFMGVNSAWAGPSFSGGYVYFHNKGGWNDSYKYLCIGKSSYTELRSMSVVTNTQLWCNSLPTSGWGDATYMAVIGNGSSWGSGNWGTSNLKNANHRTASVSLGSWGFNSNNTQMLTPESGNNDAALALTYVGSGYASMNNTITIKAKVSTNGGSSYSDANTPAKLTGSSKVFTSFTSCAGTSGASATLNAGSASTTFKAGYTANTTLTAVAATGYTFAGWHAGSTSVSANLSATVNPTGATTYYAYYKAHRYAVKFNANGGTGTMSDQAYVYGVSQALTANSFTRTGYTFAGWNTKADGTGTKYTDKQSVSNLTATDGGSVTLYAQWTPIEYTITYANLKDATHTNPTTYTIESAITFAAPTSKPAGYTFANWSPASITAGSTGNKTVTANWTADTYTITYKDQGDVTFTGTHDAGYPATHTYGTATTLKTATKDGYQFSGWFTNSGCTGTAVTTLGATAYTSGITLYAKWTQIQETTYAVTISAGANGTVSPVGVRQVGKTGLEIRATANDGYEFDTWTVTGGAKVDNASNASTTVTATAAGTVTANFLEIMRTITVGANVNHGTVNKTSLEAGISTSSASVTASTDINSGYRFVNWVASDGITIANPTSPTTNITSATKDGTLTAIFEERIYTVNVVSSNEKYGTVSPASVTAGKYTKSENIVATPAEGYQFVRWTAGTSVTITDPNSATTTVNAIAAGTVTAHFEEIPPQTIYLNPGSWTVDSARFSVYYWNSEGHAWAEMVKENAASKYYVVEIPAGYKDLKMVRLKPDNLNNSWGDPVWNESGNLTIPNDGKNLYLLDNKTVSYLHLKPNGNWKSDNARFAAYFFGNGEKWVDLEKKGDYYTCAIPTDKKYPSVIFCRMNPNGTDASNNKLNWNNKWNQTGNLTIPNDGNNLFTVNDGEWDDAKGTWSRLWDDSQWGTYTPSVSVVEKTGDYRLVYVESEVMGAAPYTKFHPSHTIAKQASGTKKDKVSFFINKESGVNPAILVQQCNVNGTTVSWETIATHYINSTRAAGDPSAALVPAQKSPQLYVGDGNAVVTQNGVYNFTLSQSGGTASILPEETELYTGNYYIRTNSATGGWNDYLNQADNRMTHSQASLGHSGYDYYFCKWVYGGKSIKYTVANDYSHCVSDTLTGDSIALGSVLPANANVRFTWNSKTNVLSRAYLAGSGNVADRFLVLEGDANLKDADGKALNVTELNAHEAIFTDMENWQYQVDVRANKNTKVKLTAKYNNKVQYFKGSEKEKVSLIESDTAYTIRLIYDFKTNHLITALMTDQTINEHIAMNEVMIIRSHHDKAKSLNLGANGRISGIENLYGVMTFNKTTIDDTKLSATERSLYWVSFPFDVNLEDVFGFGEYGEHWIMEYYDGAERAEKGGWKDATYWKYWTDPTDVTLKAGVGYVLALNITEVSKLFKSENISLYFPSATAINEITSSGNTLASVTVPAHTCEINRGTADGDRTVKDSHWNIIGIPSFSNFTNMTHGGANFYYQWDPKTDKYTAQTSADFNTMHSYMVQFAGVINWSTRSIPSQLAARQQAEQEQYNLRVALLEAENQVDQAFVRLQADEATAEFDMNIDLSKMMNHGANIYTITADKEEAAANVLPIEATHLPIGLQIAKEGDYTIALPDGTDGLSATLLDKETGAETNLLFDTYTVTLPAGTHNERFVLVLNPQQTATKVENTLNGNSEIEKYIINNQLYIRMGGVWYDAQGRMVEMK